MDSVYQTKMKLPIVPCRYVTRMYCVNITKLSVTIFHVGTHPLS